MGGGNSTDNKSVNIVKIKKEFLGVKASDLKFLKFKPEDLGLISSKKQKWKYKSRAKEYTETRDELDGEFLLVLKNRLLKRELFLFHQF